MDAELLKGLAAIGTPALMIGVWYLLERQRNRTREQEIAAWRDGFKLLGSKLDRAADRIEEHTRVDVEYHAEVQQQLGVMQATFDTALDLTPVRPVRHKTTPRGVPVTYRSPRPGTHNDGDDD